MVYLSSGYSTKPHLQVTVGSVSLFQQMFIERPFCAGAGELGVDHAEMVPAPKTLSVGRCGVKHTCCQMTSSLGCEVQRKSRQSWESIITRWKSSERSEEGLQGGREASGPPVRGISSSLQPLGGLSLPTPSFLSLTYVFPPPQTHKSFSIFHNILYIFR